MKNLLFIVLFSVFSCADNFLPLTPIYNEEKKQLLFKLVDNKDIKFDKIIQFSKKTETRVKKNFPKSKYVITTSDKICENLTFKHRKAMRKGSYFHNTYSELTRMRYDGVCSEEKVGKLSFIECNTKEKSDESKSLYAILYDDNEVEPRQSTGLYVEKKCFQKLKNIIIKI